MYTFVILLNGTTIPCVMFLSNAAGVCTTTARSTILLSLSRSLSIHFYIFFPPRTACFCCVDERQRGTEHAEKKKQNEPKEKEWFWWPLLVVARAFTFRSSYTFELGMVIEMDFCQCGL